MRDVLVKSGWRSREFMGLITSLGFPLQSSHGCSVFQTRNAVAHVEEVLCIASVREALGWDVTPDP
jgi:hypothetical protein